MNLIRSFKIRFFTNKDKQERNINIEHMANDIADDAFGYLANVKTIQGIKEQLNRLYKESKEKGNRQVLDLGGKFIWIIFPDGKLVKAFKHIEYTINE